MKRAMMAVVAWMAVAAAFSAHGWGGAAAAAGPATQPDENPYLWKPRTTSVAVFKNGLGFFMREGDANLREGWCTAKEIPPAAFGTLAIFAHAQDQVVDVVGTGPGEVVEFDNTDAPRDLPARVKRLEASRNLKLALTYKHKGLDRSAAGKLVSVGPEFVVLESEQNSFAVPIEGISKMQVLELPVRVHVSGTAGKEPAAGRLAMAYLRKGITWVPEYTFKVIDDTDGELTLRGTLVNEAEDLIHSDVHFVVGVPHFMHTEYLAPAAAGQVIRAIGSVVVPREVQSQMTNSAAVFQNRNADFEVVERPAGGAAADVRVSLPQMDGPAGSDFTVYTKKDLTLRRGEKAIVTLFVKKIKYGHLYRWSPPAEMQHYLVLLNDTDTAWTTGPCLALSGGRPLSEETLRYTPRGGKGEVQVTSAINIANEKSETEVDRKLRAYSPTKDTWLDLVTVKGELKIRNFERRPADVIVRCQVPGKPVSASDNGQFTTDPMKTLREREGMVKWQLEVKPGETKVLTYQYERYVPSN